MKINRIIRFQNDSVKVQKEQVNLTSENNISSSNDTLVMENISFPILEASCSHKGINLEEVKGTQEYIEKYFPIVKASTLSLEDEFLKYKPETKRQERFKYALILAIKSGLSDFRAQRMDACFDEEGNICFKAGMLPATGMSTKGWNKAAKDFMPEKGSRLGTKKERFAFLGLLIKYLIEEKGYTVSDAWEAVCNQSRNLGHFKDSENAKNYLEVTGSRQVGEWYDLANTCKITVDDNANGFSLVGGNYLYYGDNFPLAGDNTILNPYEGRNYSVGWLVLSV